MTGETLTLAVIGTPTAVAWAFLHARVWPLKPCPRCAARGETSPNGGRALRVCPRCGGTKRVRRLLAPRH